jgi:hypothetical protein
VLRSSKRVILLTLNNVKSEFDLNSQVYAAMIAIERIQPYDKSMENVGLNLRFES